MTIQGRIPLTVLLLVLLFAACESSTGPAEDLTITRITRPAFSGFDESQRLVIRTPAEWADAWATLWRRSSEPPALPSVNFANEMVLLVAAGSKPTTGYSITVDSVSATKQLATVTVRLTSAGTNCVTQPAVTQPVEVVRVPNRERVTFTEVLETRSC